MRNFKVMMACDGTAYHGFHDRKCYCQQIIEETIESIIGESDIWLFKTDTGVHANHTALIFCIQLITPHGFVRSMIAYCQMIWR